MITKIHNRLMSHIKLMIIVCCLLGQVLQLYAHDPVRDITEYSNLEVELTDFCINYRDIYHADCIKPAEGATISGELRIPGIVVIDSVPIPEMYYTSYCTTGKAVGFNKYKDITAVIFEYQSIYHYFQPMEYITEMEDSAFYALPKLEYAVISSASESAFANCPNLERITVINYDGNMVIGYRAFSPKTKSFANCPKLTTLDGVDVLCAGDSTFINCTALNLDGVRIYYVAGVSSFENCTSLTNVTLSHVIDVSRRAFYGCSNLKSITMDDYTISLGQYAFAGCDALTDVRCESMEPPTAYDNTFSSYTATLHVPKGTLEKYKAANVWRNFTNIVDDIETSGIASPDVYGITVKSAGDKVIVSGNDDNAAVSIYEINGRQIYHGFDNEIQMPAPGIYIVKINNTVQKVMIK